MTRSTEHIWSLMSRELAGFIRRRVADEHAAADVLQETFVRIHDGLDGLRNEDRIAAWVYQVARSAVVDHYRAAGRASAGATATVTVGALSEDAPTAANGSEPAPGDLNRTVGSWLMEMIGQLPPEYREAMTLAEQAGLTQREVADRLGLSVSGAKSRIQRGRSMLRGLLLDCCHVEVDGRGNVVDYERNHGCARCDPPPGREGRAGEP